MSNQNDSRINMQRGPVGPRTSRFRVCVFPSGELLILLFVLALKVKKSKFEETGMYIKSQK